MYTYIYIYTYMYIHIHLHMRARARARVPQDRAAREDAEFRKNTFERKA